MGSSQIDVEAQLGRAEQLIDLGRHTQAMEILTGLLRDHPDYEGHTRMLLAYLHSRTGQAHETVANARAAVALLPHLAQPHRLLGGCLADAGDLASAEAALRRALELDPQEPATWIMLSMTLSKADRDEEAFYVGRQAVALAPESAEAHHAVGMSLASASPQMAETAFTEALRVDPMFTPALRSLAFMLLRSRRRAHGARLLASYASLQPQSPIVHYIVDLALSRTISAVLLVTLLGFLPMVVALGLVWDEGAAPLIAVVAVLATATAAGALSWARARPLHRALPRAVHSHLWAMLRRRHLIVVVTVMLALLWTALVIGVILALITGSLEVLGWVVLAIPGVCITCVILRGVQFRAAVLKEAFDQES
ncbi:MAG: tetratricopeptide repeat protein [Actinomyces bowdenii]|nr:tetratricopeptide repeat protein [Actinomyces bowdenii]